MIVVIIIIVVVVVIILVATRVLPIVTLSGEGGGLGSYEKWQL